MQGGAMGGGAGREGDVFWRRTCVTERDILTQLGAPAGRRAGGGKRQYDTFRFWGPGAFREKRRGRLLAEETKYETRSIH